MSLRSVVPWPLRAALAWLLARVGNHPLRVAGAVAAVGAGGYLYRGVEAARAGGRDVLPAVVVAVQARPAYAVLAAAGVAALVLLE